MECRAVELLDTLLDSYWLLVAVELLATMSNLQNADARLEVLSEKTLLVDLYSSVYS